jgi:predicted alpha/beta superfamily hydrolase
LPSDEITTDSGGLNFYTYLTKELLPEIDSQYRTDKNNRALLGHSFGGYFVLYGLLNQLQRKTNDFKTFVSASPTVWYNNFYLNQLPDQLTTKGGPINLFISVGGNEDLTWSVTPVKDLSIEIQKRNIKELEFESRVYNHLDHMDVAVLSFTQGLQAIMPVLE